jgi:hypothetical protein
MHALETLDTWQLVALASALGWASGVRLYAVLLVVGVLGWLGWVDLPSGLAVLAHPYVLAASGFMTFMEFFADKVPGLDSLWDFVHTLVRIPAGAALAAAVFGGQGTPAVIAGAILGGTLAAGSHLTKSGARAVINTSPEPFSNWTASLMEDFGVGVLLWLAFTHPFVAGAIVLVLVLFAAWLVPKLWRGVRRLFAASGRVRGVGAGDAPGGARGVTPAGASGAHGTHHGSRG